jgi:hypothetical protein
MKQEIRFSLMDNFGNIDSDGSPIWEGYTRYDWLDLKVELGLDEELINRLRDWQKTAIEAISLKDTDQIKCEIEGLSILLELKKHLCSLPIVYYSGFSASYYTVDS